MNKTAQKIVSLWSDMVGVRATPGLLPGFLTLVLISALALLLLSGYQAQQKQLAQASRYEALASARLKQPPVFADEIERLTQGFSGAFVAAHARTDMSAPQGPRPYALADNDLTDSFFLSCPQADITARVSGLLSSEEQDSGIAVISYQGKEASYSVADRLSDDISVVRILPDRVIVDVRGYCAALLMH